MKTLVVAFAKVMVTVAPWIGLFDLSTTLRDAGYARIVTEADAEDEVRSSETGADNAVWYPSHVADVTVHDVADSHWPEYVLVLIVEPALDSVTEVGLGVSEFPAASLNVSVYWYCLSNCAMKGPPSVEPV